MGFRLSPFGERVPASGKSADNARVGLFIFLVLRGCYTNGEALRLGFGFFIWYVDKRFEKIS